MANTWLNNDKLYIKFGTSAADVATAGEYRYDGPLHMVEVKIPDMTKITATDGSYILDDAFRIGKGWRIQTVEVITDTACTGTGAVLNVGIIRSDRSTEEDFNGFLAALAQTSLTPAGKTLTLHTGDTSAGALLGTNLASTAASGYLVADYDTAAFTAGAIRIRIYYYHTTE